MFWNDTDLDNVIIVSRESCEITGDTKPKTGPPRDREAVVKKFNNGLFHQLLGQFQDKEERTLVVIFGALAMQLGVMIGDPDMKIVLSSVKHAYMQNAAKSQTRKAIEDYKNHGRAWDFERLGLIDRYNEDQCGR